MAPKVNTGLFSLSLQRVLSDNKSRTKFGSGKLLLKIVLHNFIGPSNIDVIAMKYYLVGRK